jgi:hypothetical protein
MIPAANAPPTCILAFLPCPDSASPPRPALVPRRVPDGARDQVGVECGIGFRRMHISHRGMDAGPVRMPAALSPL